MNAKMVVVILVLLALIGVGGFYFGQNYKLVPQGQTPVVTPAIPSTSSGPSAPLTAITATPIPTQIPTVDEKAALIAAVRAGLVAEHGPNANSMNITVSKIQGNFAQGGASEQGGGAMWLAAKVSGIWKLVWDGNGTISCASIDPYDFPVSLVPECWNEETGKLITR